VLLIEIRMKYLFNMENVNSANSGDVDIHNLNVTLIRTVVLEILWYQMPGCSVQCKMNKNTHGYMTVCYTNGIYVSFVNCFVVILPHHKNLLLLYNMIAILLLDLQTNKCIALLIYSQFTSFTR
jgi:hypothetical protein